MFAYVLYQGGYVHFYIAILSRIGIALGPVAALALMYGYVRLIRKEKLFDYALMNLG